jgi:hypothetical protein
MASVRSTVPRLARPSGSGCWVAFSSTPQPRHPHQAKALVGWVIERLPDTPRTHPEKPQLHPATPSDHPVKGANPVGVNVGLSGCVRSAVRTPTVPVVTVLGRHRHSPACTGAMSRAVALVLKTRSPVTGYGTLRSRSKTGGSEHAGRFSKRTATRFDRFTTQTLDRVHAGASSPRGPR